MNFKPIPKSVTKIHFLTCILHIASSRATHPSKVIPEKNTHQVSFPAQKLTGNKNLAIIRYGPVSPNNGVIAPHPLSHPLPTLGQFCRRKELRDIIPRVDIVPTLCGLAKNWDFLGNGPLGLWNDAYAEFGIVRWFEFRIMSCGLRKIGVG